MAANNFESFLRKQWAWGWIGFGTDHLPEMIAYDGDPGFIWQTFKGVSFCERSSGSSPRCSCVTSWMVRRNRNCPPVWILQFGSAGCLCLRWLHFIFSFHSSAATSSQNPLPNHPGLVLPVSRMKSCGPALWGVLQRYHDACGASW